MASKRTIAKRYIDTLCVSVITRDQLDTVRVREALQSTLDDCLDAGLITKGTVSEPRSSCSYYEL